MFRRLPWFLLLLLLAMGLEPMTAAFADRLETLQASLPEELGPWKKDGDDQFFDSTTIFDYIDGAGEVYRAYRLRKCLARRYSNQGSFLTLDVFDMGSSGDAYGVFTYDRQGDPIGLGQDGLSGAGWLRFWKGRFFVSIIDETQTPDSAQIAGTLARMASGLIREDGRRPDLVLQLPNRGLQPETVRYLHDPTILNTHYYLSDENLLHLGPATDAVLASYRRDPGSVLLLVVSYPTEKDAREAHGSVTSRYLPDAGKDGAAKLENGKWSAVAVRGGILAFVLEAGSIEQSKEMISEALDSIHARGRKE
jgi:hypothetical protein